MKILCTALMIFFISLQSQAQSEGGNRVPVNNTTNNNVDTDDLATKIMNKINACEDAECFVTFYNSMAKVCSGFKDKESGRKIITEILKLIDKKQDGVLFDVYMSKNNKHQKYFIECAKKLPTELMSELKRKSQEYLDKN
ncbi:MAG: hypothetical protein ABJH82_03340 [Polaribacter sp.]|uniref:hypothetical protein n=1 Tax=Polaribacter sp. TaxID=1920175 RepID=UPI0032646FBC